MKFLVILCVMIAFTFRFTTSDTVNIQIETKEDELKAEYCKFPKDSPFRRECALFKCSKDTSRVVVTPCPYSRCPNKLSYNLEEFPKPYPYCCAPPVC